MPATPPSVGRTVTYKAAPAASAATSSNVDEELARAEVLLAAGDAAAALAGRARDKTKPKASRSSELPNGGARGEEKRVAIRGELSPGPPRTFDGDGGRRFV